MTQITLKSSDLELILDPGFGADILSINTLKLDLVRSDLYPEPNSAGDWKIA